jgi:sugar lactone lactonase YvrE
VKGVSSNEIGVSIVRVDGQATGSNLEHPESVTADLAGFFYLVDRDNRRVLRYDLSGEFIQRVDVELNSDALPLLDPISVAADDSLAYVADRGRNQIVRYRRRP